MIDIRIKTIPHDRHRYSTVGDYWDAGGITEFRVSKMGNEDYEFLVVLHELIEEHLTRRRGIKEPDIAAFDMQFEKERDEGLHRDDEEPGDDPRCPIRREHRFAENLERMMAYELGVDWAEYSKVVEEL